MKRYFVTRLKLCTLLGYRDTKVAYGSKRVKLKVQVTLALSCENSLLFWAILKKRTFSVNL